MPGTSERLFVSPGMPGPQGLPGGHLNAVSTEIMPDSLREKIAVRAGGLWNSRYQFLPWVDDANGETRQQVDAYLEMVTRDDAIKAALLTKIYSVSSLDWQAHPVSDSPRDKLISDFVLWNYQQSEGGTASIVEELLLPALIKKYSVCEIVRREEPHEMGRWQGKMCLQQLKAREYATLEEDAFGNVTGVLGPGYRGGQSRFELVSEDGLRNFVILKNLAIFGRPISDMRPVYRWYLAKDTLIKLWLIGLEKYGNPYLIGTYPDGADDIRIALETRMAQFKAGHYGVFPEGAKIDFTTALTSAANFEQAIDRCDKGIFTAINGAFLQSMTSAGGADQRGNAQVQKSTSELFNWRLSEVVKSVVNTQLTPDFVRENFTKAEPPLISLGAINETDMKASAELDKTLLDMGLPLSKKDAEKRYSRKLAKPGSDDDLSAKKAQQGGGMGGMLGGMGGGAPPAPDSPMPDAVPMGDEMEPPDADVQFADDLSDASEGAGHDLSHDDARATQLLDDARANATDTLNDIVGRALHRNLAGNPGRLANARDFFSPQELRELQAMYRDILGPAELLGRARLALRTEQAEKFHADRASDVHHITRRFSDAPPIRFSDVPTDLHVFNDAGDQGTHITPMPPRDALDFFRRLVPGLRINPERFGQFLERESFTLAAATEQTILDRVQELIGNRIDTGEGISTAPDDIEALLDEIGVTPRNPQYAEMVVRTNMMDAYNTGAQRQAAESSEMFPAWQYSNPDDGRSRPEHAARNGQYYPTTLPFFAVRGTEIGDAANCRCTPRYIDKWEWSDLQNGGARFAQTGSGTRRFSDAWSRYRMDTHHFAWTQFKTRTGSVGAQDDKGRKVYGARAKAVLNPKQTKPKATGGTATKAAAKPAPKDDDFHPDISEAITGVKAAPKPAKADPAKAKAEQKQAQKDFEDFGLPKIKAFESRTGRPWMDLVLKQAGQASGQTVQQVWHSIAQGDRVPHVDAILANEDFQHDYGKVSSGSFAGIVQALKSSGYIPGAKYRGQTAVNARAGEGERPKGMISDLTDAKLRAQDLLPGDAPKPMPSAARKTTKKDKTIPLGEPSGGKSSAYDAFGIKSPDQEREERRQFESVHLPKIKSFEKRTGQPWLDMVLRQAGQESGKSPEQMWQTLSEGGHAPEVARILTNEDFAHDYGTMTPDDLGKMVDVLKNAGYIPAAKYRGSTRGDKAERPKGMISDVPAAKMKKAGLTTGRAKKFADMMFAMGRFFRGLWR